MGAKAAISTKDMGGLRIINQGDGVDPQDSATFGQVEQAENNANTYTDNAIAGLASGQVLKGSVRAVVATNVNIASPGATLDGLTAANGDVFLLAGQTTGSQNGPYVFNGAAAAMTRATNWDTAEEAVVGSYWIVREGTQADKFALLTNDTFTLGTTTATFAYLGAIAGGGYTSFAGAVPAVAAGGTATVTHNLGTRDVGVQIVRTGSPYDEVEVRVERATTNTISVMPDVAITNGEFRALVWKVGA